MPTNLGAILLLRPPIVGVNQTLTIEVPAAERHRLAFGSSVDAFLVGDTPSTRAAIQSSQPVSGSLSVRTAPNVVSPSQLQLTVPSDAALVARANGVPQFFVNIRSADVWAWSRVGFTLASPGSPTVWGNRGAVLDLAPARSALGGTVTVRVSNDPYFQFTGPLQVRLFPSSPQLNALISGVGTITGHVHVRASDVTVIDRRRLSFRVPHDVATIMAALGVGQFAVQVDVGSASAWTRTGLQIDATTSLSPSSPSTPSFYSSTMGGATGSGSPIPYLSHAVLNASTAFGVGSGAFVHPPPNASPSPLAPSPAGTATPPAAPPVGPVGTINTGASNSEPEPPQLEEYTAWLVEEYWPVRTPKVRSYRAVVSVQRLRYPIIPVKGQNARLEALMPVSPSIEVAKVLAAGSKIEDVQKPNGASSAPTNSEGKVFFLVEIPLVEKLLVTERADLLQGLRVRFGKPSSVSETMPSTSGGATGPGGGGVMIAGGLHPGKQLLDDILVPPKAPQVTAPLEHDRDGEHADAGITRVEEFFYRRFLEAMAIYLDFAYPIPRHIDFDDPLTGTTIDFTITDDEAKGVHLGFFLGAGRGVFVAGRDTVQEFFDLAEMAMTMIEKALQLVESDDWFALKVIAAVSSPVVGIVLYALDDDFRTRIRSYYEEFTQKAGEVIDLVTQAAGYAWEYRSQLMGALASQIYKSFEELVGFIPRDYLEFQPGSPPYDYFLCAFMAADVMAYIGATIGIQLAMTYLTAGVGSYLSGLAKAGRLGKLAKLVELVQRIFTIIEEIGDALHSKAAEVLSGAIKVLSEVPMRYLRILFDAIDQGVERIAKVLRRHVLTDGGDPLRALVETLKADTFPEDHVERLIRLLKNWDDGLDRQGNRVLPEGTGFCAHCPSVPFDLTGGD